MRYFAIILSLVLSAAAHAASLPSLRSELSKAASRAQELHEQRQQLERSLDEVARHIEALKSEREAKGALFHDAKLDELLGQSQELSSHLSAALASERAAEQGLAAQESKLAAGLDRELELLRAQWDRSTGREERRGLVPRLRGLRAEREALRRAPAAVAVRALPEAFSDDPEELLERADALLDGEDKLRREERALQVRIGQLERERELERRMDEFLGEGALFDEQDRRISVSRPAAVELGAANPAKSEARDTASSPSSPAPVATPPPGGTNDTDGYFNGGESSSVELGGGGSVTSPRNPASPGRQGGFDPLVDSGPRSGISRTPPDRQGALGAWSDDESLEELEARQTQLRARANDLHRKAEEASRQARDLL